MERFHSLKAGDRGGDPRLVRWFWDVYHDPCFGGKALTEMENVGLNCSDWVFGSVEAQPRRVGGFAWRVPILVITSKVILRHSKLFGGHFPLRERLLCLALARVSSTYSEGTSSGGNPTVLFNYCILGVSCVLLYYLSPLIYRTLICNHALFCF